MPFRTTFTKLVNIEIPIMQAPIGSCSCPELAAAVSNAGGLGMMALSWDPVESCRRKIKSTLEQTQRPFGINLVLEWDQSERLEACLAEGARVVSLFWGDPKSYLKQAHAAGAKTIVSVGSAQEARRAADLGADAVLCQGLEAGGHVRGQVASMVLIPTVVNAVHQLPVIAAGGFADARGLVAALSLGAAGICMGTRFVATSESRAHPLYKQRIVEAPAEDAVYTYLFDGGWEGAPHRVLRNSTFEAWKEAGQPAHGERPREGEIIGSIGKGQPITRYDDMPPITGMQGDWEACALYAGQSAALVHSVKSAAALVHEIMEEAEQVIHKLHTMDENSAGQLQDRS